MTLSRRGFFTGLAATAVTAPSIVRAASLMPVKSFCLPEQLILVKYRVYPNNRVIRTCIDVCAITDRNILLGFHDYAGGVPCPIFRDIPIRVIDAA
jgi:hypothetical protein